eukprot:scaffold2515_cov136-Amphora_coffeaeformis.AAC.4
MAAAAPMTPAATTMSTAAAMAATKEPRATAVTQAKGIERNCPKMMHGARGRFNSDQGQKEYVERTYNKYTDMRH